jgi:hypothetical protein
MRKLIIGSSLAVITVFAVLLANADEGQDSMPSSPQPGISESADTSTPHGTAASKERIQARSKEHAAKGDHWKTAKTCTDESGVIHKRGQKGFNTCVEHMRQKEAQMGGTVAPKASPKVHDSESSEGSSNQ